MKSDKTTSIVKILTIGAVVAVLAPPVVNAATSNVKIQDADSQGKAQVKNGALKITDGGGAMNVTGNVKAKDSQGDNINSRPIRDMGLFDAPGSSGAMDVATFAGGGGFLAAGDCVEENEDTEANPTATPQDNTFTIEPSEEEDVILTSILFTGSSTTPGPPDAQLRVYSGALGEGQLPLLGFQVNENSPNEVFSSPGGLTITDDLIFTCTKGSAPGAAGDGQWVVLGQGSVAGLGG